VPWVIDASAAVEVLLDTDLAPRVRAIVGSEELLAPDLINAEILSSFRRLVAAGELSRERADAAIEDLAESPIERVFTTTLVPEVWSLRDRLSAYDAQYVALARAIGCGVVTTDLRMSRAHGVGVAIATP
jgi:predicted nucleic acid-binding protein